MAKILLVEDNEMNRDMLSRRLERRGYTVVPVMDGWEATRQLKSTLETKDIPIIALTAHAMASDEQKAREAGCDDFDTKPIELPRLLAKIEMLLQHGRAGEKIGR